MQPQRKREVPRISVNKLAEYMIASPARRRGIIRDQKQPPDFVVGRYAAVYDGICECLLANCSVKPVRERITQLYSAVPKTTWQAQDLQLSAEALEAFLSFVDEIDLSGFRLTRGGDDAPMLRVSDVAISVRPELLLHGSTPNSTVGALKIYVSKNSPFEDRSGEYAGAIVHQYVAEILAADTKVETANCYVIDVFQRRVYVAPRTYKKRRSDVAAACEEIAQRWAAI